jgi:hypothetical protein
MEQLDQTTLTIVDIIKGVIAGEVGCLIYPEGKKPGDIFQQTHAYIKFLPVVSSIEFLGACYDEFPFDMPRMEQRDIVEDRFNKALKELFKKDYLRFTKASHQHYFYKKLRCSMIHQLRPGRGILFTTRKEAIDDKNKHLQEDEGGNLILVLEDLYDDLQKAALKLVRLFEEKKLTNKKGDQAFIQIISVIKENNEKKAPKNMSEKEPDYSNF